MRPGKEDLEPENDHGHGQSRWREEDVNGDDVDDDRREQSERERDEAVAQERSAGSRIDRKEQREDVAAGDESADELSGLAPE